MKMKRLLSLPITRGIMPPSDVTARNIASLTLIVAAPLIGILVFIMNWWMRQIFYGGF